MSTVNAADGAFSGNAQVCQRHDQRELALLSHIPRTAGYEFRGVRGRAESDTGKL